MIKTWLTKACKASYADGWVSIYMAAGHQGDRRELPGGHLSGARLKAVNEAMNACVPAS